MKLLFLSLVIVVLDDVAILVLFLLFQCHFVLAGSNGSEAPSSDSYFLHFMVLAIAIIFTEEACQSWLSDWLSLSRF